MAKSYKSWVRNLVANVSAELNLQGWRIDLCWEKDYPDGNDSVVAHVEVMSDYYKASIHFTPYAEEIWKEGRVEVLGECIVHELVHILVDPVYQIAKKSSSEVTFPYLTSMNEQTTQRITRIVMQLLPPKFFSR